MKKKSEIIHTTETSKDQNITVCLEKLRYTFGKLFTINGLIFPFFADDRIQTTKRTFALLTIFVNLRPYLMEYVGTEVL